MKIADARRAPKARKPVESAHRQLSRGITFPAPSNGLVSSASLAVDVPGSALILDNMIPTERGARIRGGLTHTALLNVIAGVDTVRMFAHREGGVEQLFVSTATEIFDITSPPAPPTKVSAILGALTNGDWVSMQQTTAGGTYLIIVNGANPPKSYDGTTWALPSITGVTGGSSTLDYCWLFKNRGFFTQVGTMDAYYLPVNAIAGAAAVFPLGGIMDRGGELIAGFDWSVDAGDGLSDLCCFLSSEGEVAVYAGSDPATAADWVLKGVYNVGKPIGKHAIMKAGGDVLIATKHGLISMAQAFLNDERALRDISVSKAIENLWLEETELRGTNWQIGEWSDKALAFFSMPEAAGAPDTVFVVNVLTGKWGTISGWNARCWETIGGQLYIGGVEGKIYTAETAGSDDGLPYIISYLGTFQSVGDRGRKKVARLATAELNASIELNVKLFVRTDFDTGLPSLPAVSTNAGGGLGWGAGLWGTAIWGDGGTASRRTIRQSVTGVGNSVAVGLLAVIDSSVPVTGELLLTTVQMEDGEAVI